MWQSSQERRSLLGGFLGKVFLYFSKLLTWKLWQPIVARKGTSLRTKPICQERQKRKVEVSILGSPQILLGLQENRYILPFLWEWMHFGPHLVMVKVYSRLCGGQSRWCQGTMWGARDQRGVSGLQGKHLVCSRADISFSQYFLFFFGSWKLNTNHFQSLPCCDGSN